MIERRKRGSGQEEGSLLDGEKEERPPSNFPLFLPPSSFLRLSLSRLLSQVVGLILLLLYSTQLGLIFSPVCDLSQDRKANAPLFPARQKVFFAS